MDKVFPYAVTIASAGIRILPHPWSMTPINSAVNYTSVTVKNKIMKYLLPILMVFVSDIIINMIYGADLFGIYMLYVYPVYVFNTYLASSIIQKPHKGVNIFVGATITTFSFFILSNFGYYLKEGEYTWAKLSDVYINGVPYYGKDVVGTLLYSLVIFGLHNFLIKPNNNNESGIHQSSFDASEEKLILNR